MTNDETDSGTEHATADWLTSAESETLSVYEVASVIGSACRPGKAERGRDNEISIRIILPLESDPDVEILDVYVKTKKRNDAALADDVVEVVEFTRDLGDALRVSFSGSLDMSDVGVEVGDKFFEIFKDSDLSLLFARSWKDTGPGYEFTHKPGFKLVESCP